MPNRERQILDQFIQGIVTIADKFMHGQNSLESLRWYGGECPNIVFIHDGFGNEPPWEITIALSIRPLPQASEQTDVYSTEVKP